MPGLWYELFQMSKSLEAHNMPHVKMHKALSREYL